MFSFNSALLEKCPKVLLLVIATYKQWRSRCACKAGSLLEKYYHGQVKRWTTKHIGERTEFMLHETHISFQSTNAYLVFAY